MPLCTITGTVYLPSGEPARSRVLVFKRGDKRFASTDDGVIMPRDVYARTTRTGTISVDLFTGQYSVHSEEFTGSVIVPNDVFALFEDVVSA